MVVIWKSKARVANIPKVGKINVIKIGDVKFPAIKAVLIRPDDYAYTKYAQRIPNLAPSPRKVRIDAIDLKVHRDYMEIATPGDYGMVPKAAYVAVPLSTYRKRMPIAIPKTRVQPPKPQVPRVQTPRSMASMSMDGVRNAAVRSMRAAKVRVPKPRVPDLEF